MKAISLFSGVGGLDLGFQRAGIETVLQAERDKWCNEVLARHWPQVARVDDVRDVGQRGYTPVDAYSQRTWADAGRASGSVDLVYGGFPCQDVSVAGKRAGLGGERSNLWFEFRRVVDELRPRWCVVENVPGLHSSARGEDFTVVTAGLVELGYGVAWGVLDAKFYGVAQRRRRVFIVATRDPDGRAGAERCAAILSVSGSRTGNPAAGGTAGEGVAATLGGGSAESQRGFRDDLDTSTYVLASTLRGRSHGDGVNMPGRGGEEAFGDNLITESVALRGRDGGATAELGGPQANALRSSQGGGDKGFVLAPTLDTHLGDKQWLEDQSVGNFDVMRAAGAGVRRLTPLECNRLQGFPDDWDRWTADGKEIADSHRYRMMGNAVCVPVAEWLGHRLVAVAALR